MAFQCGLFQLSFSSGVAVYPASIRWVAQWYPSVHWVNQWHSSGIPVYTGPASVHWLRVRGPWTVRRMPLKWLRMPRVTQVTICTTLEQQTQLVPLMSELTHPIHSRPLQSRDKWICGAIYIYIYIFFRFVWNLRTACASWKDSLVIYSAERQHWFCNKRDYTHVTTEAMINNLPIAIDVSRYQISFLFIILVVCQWLSLWNFSKYFEYVSGTTSMQ